MSTTYSPSGTFPTWPLILPTDGDIVSFATLCVAILEPLIDAAGENAPRNFTAAQTFTAAPCYTGDSVGDVDGTIGNTAAFWTLAAATVLRADTVDKSTAPTPSDWQTIRVKMEPGGAAVRRLLREDATIIATLANDATAPAVCELYFDPGVGDWRLGLYSPFVTPGPSA